MPEITASVLSAMGISDQSLQTTIARSYLSSIRNMLLLKDYGSALGMLEVLHSSGFESAERWVIADSHLCAAKIYWSQTKYLQYFRSCIVAVIKRPVVLGRPFKSAVHAMFAAFAT
jgi:hypothetical protein